MGSFSLTWLRTIYWAFKTGDYANDTAAVASMQPLYPLSIGLLPEPIGLLQQSIIIMAFLLIFTYKVNKLQRIENAAARLLTNTPSICIVLLTFKCLHGLAPQYLVDLIAVAAQSRYNLRSRNATLLVPANARCLPTLADRAFHSAAPKLWNSLPAEIRNIQSLTSFKRALKTNLFKIAFNWPD